MKNECYNEVKVMETGNGFEEILRHAGLKYTKHRVSVLEVLTGSDQPISADQVFLELQKNGVNANLSTVYRILESLASKGLAVKSKIGSDNKALFEISSTEHRHRMICIKCKKMTSVEGCPLKEYEKMLRDRTGFDVTGHKLEIYGYCEDCRLHERKDDS